MIIYRTVKVKSGEYRIQYKDYNDSKYIYYEWNFVSSNDLEPFYETQEEAQKWVDRNTIIDIF